jgi:hypothetical protein
MTRPSSLFIGKDEMQTLSVKNWSEFQHYKDRSPSWIKLHKRVLDDRDFQRLPAASRALAPMLWLLASEYNDGILPYDLDLFAFRTRQTEKEIENALKPLIDKGFLILSQDASEMLAEVEHDAISRREENINKEKRREEVFVLPDFIDKAAWAGYCEMRTVTKKKMTDRARDQLIDRLRVMHSKGVNITAALDQSILKCYTDVYEVKPDGNGKAHPEELQPTPKEQSFAWRNSQ